MPLSSLDWSWISHRMIAHLPVKIIPNLYNYLRLLKQPLHAPSISNQSNLQRKRPTTCPQHLHQGRHHESTSTNTLSAENANSSSSLTTANVRSGMLGRHTKCAEVHVLLVGRTCDLSHRARVKETRNLSGQMEKVGRCRVGGWTGVKGMIFIMETLKYCRLGLR